MIESIQPVPIKETISMADLDKIDVRVGTIVRVEDLPRSGKVSILTVEFGDRRRTILASLREERENPAEIEGKQALFVLNLPPRKISGVTSEGMLFDIGYADGIQPALAMPERPVPDGSRLG